MADFLRGQSALYKLVAISVAGLLLGFGLCSAGVAFDNGWITPVGLSVFWLSALGLVVSMVWAVIKGLTGGRR